MRNPEIFDQFVNVGNIGYNLLENGIDSNEAEVAALAIQKTRAQWVVDQALLELTSRSADLLDRKQILSTELKSIDQELGIIKASQNQRNRVQPKIEGHHSWFEYDGKYSAFYDSLKEEAPCILWLERLDPHSGFTLIPWHMAHREEIQQRYGKHAGNFERASDLLARLRVAEWGSDRGVAGLIESPDNPSIAALKVDDTEKFISAALCIDGLGLKTAAAILCIADMQKAACISGPDSANS